MGPKKTFAALLLIVMLAAATAFAQKGTTGGIKGKVRGENGSGASGVTVILRQGERELTRVVTNGKGEFSLAGLEPGTYGLTFRKPGLSRELTG